MNTRSSQTRTSDGRGALEYLPALDGIRALAILAVLAYHTAPSLFPGGFIGVDVFFVVSGFIITRALAVEYGANGSVSLLQFWQRRAKRLLPALVLLLAGLMFYAVTFEPDRLARLRGDALPALAYVTNWYLIFDQQSYFDSFSPPSTLRHLWSLAVEEQFYILWPIAFGAASRWLSRKALVTGALALAAFSSLTMAVLYQAGADASRLYYGTDTRASGFLMGAALALMLTHTQTSHRPTRSSVTAAIVAMTALTSLVLTLPSEARITYQGGLLGVAILSSAILYATVTAQHSSLSRALAVAPLRWLGVRSYGIYLWHWPLVVLASPELGLPFSGLALAILQIGLAVGLAALSYALVEQPIRQGALGRIFAERRALSRYAVAAGGSVALVFVGISACTTSAETPEYMRREAVSGFVTPVLDPRAPSRHAVEPTPTVTRPNAPGPLDRTSCDSVRGTSYRSDTERSWFLMNCTTPVASPTESNGEAPRVDATSAGARAPSAPTPAPPSVPADEPGPIAGSFVTAVGDSVMLGAADALAAIFSNIYVDAAVSRHTAAGISVLRSLQSSGQLGAIVVVHLGNNGTFSESHLHEIMSITGSDRAVVFVTTKVDRSWEASNNAAISNAASAYANARVADWRSISGGRPDLFWDDGIHLRPEGAALYAQLIGSMIR